MKNSCGTVTTLRCIWALPAFILLSTVLCSVLFAREITDMAGRKVVVPETIKRVYTDYPIMMCLVYAVDPTLLAGNNASFTEQRKKYLHPHVRALPMVQGFFGKGAPANIETVALGKPDVVIAEIWNMPLNERSVKVLGRLGIPVVYVKLDTTSDYPAAFLFLGNLFGREKRARVLAKYGEYVLKETAHIIRKIPQAKRPSIYYAEGVAGLSTECNTSFHTELIELAGATNVYRCSNGILKTIGREVTSLEQVLRYDPEVIIAADSSFYKNVFKDARWRNIRAVKSGRVYLTPGILFNWFDRPPSFMRLFGIRWLNNCLYPDIFQMDMIKEVQEFYRLFLNLEISEATVKEILYP